MRQVGFCMVLTFLHLIKVFYTLFSVVSLGLDPAHPDLLLLNCLTIVRTSLHHGLTNLQ